MAAQIDLKEALEVMFAKLVEKGVLPAEKKDSIIQSLLESPGMKKAFPEGKIDADVLRDVNVQKMFTLALVSSFIMQNNPEFKINMGVLFQKNDANLTPEERNELRLEAKNEITKMLLALNLLAPAGKQLSPEKINTIANNIVASQFGAESPEESLAQNNGMAKLLALTLKNVMKKPSKDPKEELARLSAMRSVFGDVEGQIPAPVPVMMAIIFPLLGPAISAEVGIGEQALSNTANADGYGTDAAKQELAEDLGAPIDTPTEIAHYLKSHASAPSLIDDMCSMAESLTSDVTDTLTDMPGMHKSPSPFNTTMRGPGNIH